MKTSKFRPKLMAIVIAGLCAVSVNAYAAGQGSGSGGKPVSEAAQNLSVPAILVGSLGTLVCGPSDAAPSVLVPPTGTPLTGYEVPGYYWVQKVHTWQAQCFNASAASVFGAWGDNLAGDAKLKTEVSRWYSATVACLCSRYGAITRSGEEYASPAITNSHRWHNLSSAGRATASVPLESDTALERHS